MWPGFIESDDESKEREELEQYADDVYEDEEMEGDSEGSEESD